MLVLRAIGGGVTIAIALTVLGILAAYWWFANGIGGDVAQLVASAGPSGVVVDDGMIAGLPEPARRYLTHAGVPGTAIPRIVRLSQNGRIRSAADANWMNFTADEIYSTAPPALVWRAYFPSRFMPVVMGRDEYLGGDASILMKIFALVPVADEKGEELRAAGLMRYLNEMMWFPAAYLGSNVTIIARDDVSFDVSIADRGMTVTGTIFVDAKGAVTSFRARRYNTGSRSVEIWETPITGEGSYGGLNLPRGGSGVWRLSSGEFAYIELEVTDVAYED